MSAHAYRNNMGSGSMTDSNYLLMHAMGPNVAGVIGSAVSSPRRVSHSSLNQ